MAVEPDPPSVDGPHDDPLWNRLQSVDLDHADADLPFSLRLARENGWSRYFAKRAIDEYKKFCYLAVRTRYPVTPSDQVDQVWHLHLLYTWNYWEEFCPKVLECKLHHGPTRGGTAERAKFRTWYENTLHSYRQIFGLPPDDVWPAAEERFSGTSTFRRFNTRDQWLLPNPHAVLTRLRRG